MAMLGPWPVSPRLLSVSSPCLTRLSSPDPCSRVYLETRERCQKTGHGFRMRMSYKWIQSQNGSKVEQLRGCQGEVNWCRADNMSVTPIPHVTDTHDSHDGAQPMPCSGTKSGSKVRLSVSGETGRGRQRPGPGS